VPVRPLSLSPSLLLPPSLFLSLSLSLRPKIKNTRCINTGVASVDVGARVWLSGSVSGTYAEYCVSKVGVRVRVRVRVLVRVRVRVRVRVVCLWLWLCLCLCLCVCGCGCGCVCVHVSVSESVRVCTLRLSTASPRRSMCP
jgi:hypothetical protein